MGIVCLSRFQARPAGIRTANPGEPTRSPLFEYVLVFPPPPYTLVARLGEFRLPFAGECRPGRGGGVGPARRPALSPTVDRLECIAPAASNTLVGLDEVDRRACPAWPRCCVCIERRGGGVRLVLARDVMPTSSSDVKPLFERLRLPLGAMYAALTLPLGWSKMDGELPR